MKKSDRADAAYSAPPRRASKRRAAAAD